MTKVLKLSLLGQLQLAYGETPLLGLASGKAQALLCYLALDGRPHSRQALAGLLWGDLPEADARRNLRGALLKLRHAVEPHLLISHQSLAFNSDSDYWLDVEIFRRCLDPRLGSISAPAQLRQAVALYRGDFLEDFYVRQAPAFEEWVARQRAQLQELAIQAYHVLARYHGQQGDYTTAEADARRLLEIDPAREEAHRHLMQLLALSGQRSRALAQYDTCRDILRDELGVEPAAETIDLYRRIRSGELSKEAEGQGSRGAGEIFSPPHPRDRRLPTPAPLHTSALEQKLPVDDLPTFIAGPPITHPARFFGRDYELKRLFNLFRRLPLQNAALVGPRRSGKTSLLHYLKSITTANPAQLRPGQRTDWLAQPEHVRWIFVDFQDPRLGGSEGLLRHLLAHMALPVPEPCHLDTFLDVVADNLRTPTVVLFDEIGVALQRYPELDDAFWESLRSLATNQVGGKLGFVLAASAPPNALARYSGLGSPFFNIFGYTATLGPLSEAAARELLATSPLPFPEADVDWMLHSSGRWPILLQILGRERLLALEDGETGQGWRQDALRQMAPFKRALLEDEGVKG